MKDLVERQAVLDLIHENWYASNEFYLNHIMEIPSIDDISVRHGKFIGTEYDGYADGNPVYYEWKCSECGCIFEEDEPMYRYRYCPYCGARMDERKEG